MLTEQEVKDQLPNVTVKLPGGKIVDAIVAGRNKPFAMIFSDGNFIGEWNWKAVTRCINQKTPLKA